MSAIGSIYIPLIQLYQTYLSSKNQPTKLSKHKSLLAVPTKAVSAEKNKDKKPP